MADCAEVRDKDAARYRWLRLNPDFESEAALMGMTPEMYDAAVDAAMAADTAAND